MIRNLKVVGLALGALFAMSAVGASAAQATSSLDIGSNPAILTAQQKTQLKFTLTASGLVVKCTTANLEGTTAASNVTQVTVTPQYSGCTLGGTATTIDINGCKFLITGTNSARTAEVDIQGCNPGKHLTITQGTCEITVPEGGPYSHTVFTNVANQTPTEADVNVTFAGIHYVGEGGCGTNVNGAHEDGDLTGETTLKAFQDSGGVEGTQVSLEAT
jgi:hypothetical protein